MHYSRRRDVGASSFKTGEKIPTGGKMKKVLSMLAVAILVAACGGNEAAMFGKAQHLTDLGQYDKAIQVYSQIIKNNPDNDVAYAKRGLLYERLQSKDAAQNKKNKASAQRDYERSINLNYNRPEVYNNLAALYIDQGYYGEAVLNLNEALILQPDYFVAYVNRAIAEGKQGKFREALLDYSRAESLNPASGLVYLNRGLTQFAAGYYASAAEDYSRAMELEPENPRPVLERGRAFIKLGYFQNAMDDFQHAMALQADYAMPYYYAAELLFSRGETEEAIAYAQQAKQLAPNYAPIYDMLGDMLALESPVEATQHYLAARRLDPAHSKRYEQKIRMMNDEEGRKRVVAYRFMNLDKK